MKQPCDRCGGRTYHLKWCRHWVEKPKKADPHPRPTDAELEWAIAVILAAQDKKRKDDR